MLAVQATARQLRPLLLECDDFGGRTSFNSLRIIHGGLRYLQTMDLPRYVESVRERRWFLSEFSEFVQPLGCLMPLYGRGLKRKSVLRIALWLNDILSAGRNSGLPEANRLPDGRVVTTDEVGRMFPGVDRSGLKGGALWYDAALPDTPRVMIESMHWATRYGADCLNYMDVRGLEADAGRVTGVRASDQATGADYTFSAPVVINATGPWSDLLANRLGLDREPMFPPSLAWNLLMDQPAPSEHALALIPKRPGAPTYFVHPWKGRLLVGTGHAAWSGEVSEPMPTAEQVQHMLDDLNLAMPQLDLRPDGIQRILAGYLPTSRAGSAELSVRPVIRNHGRDDGIQGLFTVIGVKFTTASDIACQALDLIFGKASNSVSGFARPDSRSDWQFGGRVDLANRAVVDAALNRLRSLITDESVVHLDDLISRRTDLWEYPELARELAPSICELFAWDERRRSDELARLDRTLDQSSA